MLFCYMTDDRWTLFSTQNPDRASEAAWGGGEFRGQHRLQPPHRSRGQRDLCQDATQPQW